MVLSSDGDHLMTRLSDTQLVILSAAAQRADLAVLPLPDSLNLKGGALNKVMDSLRERGLIRVLGGDGGPERVVITGEGRAAMGGGGGDGAARPPADTGATPAESDGAVDTSTPAADAGSAATPAKRKAPRKAKAKAAPAAGEPEGQP